MDGRLTDDLPLVEIRGLLAKWIADDLRERVLADHERREALRRELDAPA